MNEEIRVIEMKEVPKVEDLEREVVDLKDRLKRLLDRTAFREEQERNLYMNMREELNVAHSRAQAASTALHAQATELALMVQECQKLRDANLPRVRESVVGVPCNCTFNADDEPYHQTRCVSRLSVQDLVTEYDNLREDLQQARRSADARVVDLSNSVTRMQEACANYAKLLEQANANIARLEDLNGRLRLDSSAV